MKYSRTESGFTIVELLIVVVVIGILAAITIVAYTNVQSRAYNAQVTGNVSQFNTALKAYAAENDSYPSFGGSACLGVGYADTSGDGVGDCGASDYPTSENSDFNTAMKSFLGSIPTVSAKPIDIGGGVTFTGATVVNWDEFTMNGEATPYYMMYALKGNAKSCGSDEVAAIDGGWPHMKTADQSYSWTGDSYTMCVVPLPNA